MLPFISVELSKAHNLHFRSRKHDQHGRNPYCSTRISRRPAIPACQITTCRTPSRVFREKKSVPVRLVVLYSVAAALESAAAQQKQKQVYVAAVVRAARHMGPEPGQCRCACVSSINLLKIGILVQQHAAAKSILHSYIT